jgi:O-antigen/teichoic acid export membrane protein
MRSLIGRRGSFAADTLVTLAGGSIARLVTLASMPFVTRIYAASDYGSWVIVLALAGLLLPFATMRYELAIVLAPTRRLAAGLALAIGAFTIPVVLVAGAVCLTAPTGVLEAISGVAPDRMAIVGLVPPILIVLAAQAILQAWATREHRFVALSLAQMVQAVVTAAAILSMPFAFGANAMTVTAAAILGLVCGQIALAASSAGDLLASMRQRAPGVAALHGLRRYKVYALYVLPYSLSAAIAERVLQIVLASAYSLATLGAFFAARQIMSAPAILVGNALRQVLFAYGAQQDTREQTKERVGRLLRLFTDLIFPALAFGIVWLRPVVIIVFGDKWPFLPDFAWWFMLVGASALLTGGFDRLLDVLGRQRVSVALQVASDVVLISVVLLGSYAGLSAISIVAALAIVITLTNLARLVVVARFLGFAWREISALLVRLAGGTAIFATMQFAVSKLDEGWLGLFSGSLLLAAPLLPTLVKAMGALTPAPTRANHSPPSA